MRDHQFDRKTGLNGLFPGVIYLGRAWALGILQLGLGGWSLVAGAGCSWKWTLGLPFVSSLMTWSIRGPPEEFSNEVPNFVMDHSGHCCRRDAPAPLLYLWAVAMGAYVRVYRGTPEASPSHLKPKNT